MAERTNTPESTPPRSDVEPPLPSLTLSCRMEQSAALAQHAAHQAWSPVASVARRAEGAATLRRDRATPSRLRLAHFPVITTVAPCRGDWPTRMNRLQVQPQFHRTFLQDTSTLIFLGGGGLGKTHLAPALGSAACLPGSAVLFASAIEVLHTLAAAKGAGRRKAARKPYPQPALLSLDELGSRPLDKAGADLLFHVLSLRSEQGAIVMTSNRAFKAWPTIFHHDSPLTAAILDRLLHHAETVISEGKSFRMKDQLER